MEGEISEIDTDSDRRRFLKALGALSVVGLAGCGGDGDDETPTDTEAGGNGNGNGNGNGTTETETPTEPTETPTDTETPSGGDLPDDPAPLIALIDEGISPEADTLNATITNSYLFEIQNGNVELEGPEDWELSPADGTSFDTLESQATREASWDLSLPDGVSGEYELTANVTYSAGEEAADVTASLPITVDVWIGNEFAEIAHFEDVWSGGLEDRMWQPPGVEDFEDWGGHSPKGWYKYEFDVSAFLPADRIQFRFDDPYTGGGWGPSLWDTRLVADGEETQYLRTIFDNDEEYIYDGSSQQDVGGSESDQGWRFADAQNYWVYEFEVPDDPDELVVEFTLRNAFQISARSFPSSDATKDDVTGTMTPALRIPYTGDAGGGITEMEVQVPDMGPESVLLGAGIDLPHTDTFEIANESEVDGADDISAAVYTGYDEDNLYLRVDVTDDTHVAKSGEDMWQGDSIQILAGNEEYGPEDGISHVDGETATHEWFEGGSSGLDAVDVTTSRNDDENLTQYELTIPWGSLYSDFTAEPGGNAPFGLLVNESDTDNDERDAWLGWPVPSPTKEVGDLGTLLLENPIEN